MERIEVTQSEMKEFLIRNRAKKDGASDPGAAGYDPPPAGVPCELLYIIHAF